ncbi:hypothetical protein J6590_058984, partial [Homalodisca vitripennis]
QLCTASHLGLSEDLPSLEHKLSSHRNILTLYLMGDTFWCFLFPATYKDNSSCFCHISLTQETVTAIPLPSSPDIGAYCRTPLRVPQRLKAFLMVPAETLHLPNVS